MNNIALPITRRPFFDNLSRIMFAVILGFMGTFFSLSPVLGESPEALYIDPAGNVGIGTNTPDAELDVKGQVNAQRLNVAENIGTGNLGVQGKVTAGEVQVTGMAQVQELQATGSVNAAQVNVAGVINAQRIVATGAIDSVPHWDSGWVAVSLTVPKFVIAQNHNLGAIPSRYTLQYKLQNVPDEIYVLSGGDVLQLAMKAMWKPNAALTLSIEYEGPFHFYPAVKFSTSQVKLEAFLVPLRPKEAKISVSMPGPVKIAPPKIDITELPIEAVLNPPGAFRILLWK